MNRPETVAAAARPYPWVYTPSLKAKLGLCALGVFCAGMGLAGIAWPILWPEPFWGWGIKAFLMVACAGFVLLGVYCAFEAFACATILTATSVERKDLFGRQAMRKADIAGYRHSERSNNFDSVTLYPKAKGPSLKILLLRADPDFEGWFASIPNLDEKERDEAQARLLKDHNLGGSVKARKARLKRFGRLSMAANGVGFGVLGWVWFFPRPYEVAIAVAAAMPVVALALVVVARGALAFDSSAKTDPRGDVSGLVFGGFAVGLRALVDIHVFDWLEGMRPLAVVFPLAMGLTWAMRDRIKDTRASRIVFAVAVSLLGWGYATEANMLLDRSKAQVFPVKVLDMRISSGKHTSYDLTLTPWGPQAKSQEIDVGQAFYKRTHAGDTLCVYLWSGAFRVRWFDVDQCPKSPATR